MRRIATGLCVAASFALGVTVAAQQTPPTPQTTMAADKDAKAVTLTGCLQEGADAGSFKLANAVVETAKPAGATAAGTSGTTAGTATGGAATGTASAAHGSEAPATWTLDPGSVDLKPHVGHKVQVMGTAASDTATSKTEAKGTSTTASGAKTETSVKGELSMGGHKLNVTSVKHIAETCPM